jgi:hypothetical protein
MSRPRRPRPPHRRRMPGWLRDALGSAARLLAVSVAAAVLNGVGVAPVTGACPGADQRPTPVTAQNPSIVMPFDRSYSRWM